MTSTFCKKKFNKLILHIGGKRCFTINSLFLFANSLVQFRLLMKITQFYRHLSVAAYSVICFSLSPTSTLACTALQLGGQDGSFIQARTMEWGAFDMKPELLVFPKGYAFTGITPEGENGLKWQAEYGAVGVNALGRPLVADGMNEKGLVVSVLYLPGYAEYQPYEKEKAETSLSPLQVCLWMLTSYSTVDEVRKGLDEVRVVPVPEKEIGNIPPPLHYMVTDASGKTIVVEYTKNRLQVYDNKVGVLTNSPSFDWHLTNLKAYAGLGVKEARPVQVGEMTVKPLGVGSGLLGLPGDYTPPSRFIRVAALRNTVVEMESGARAVEEAFRILNNFDIPIGTMEGKHDPSILGDTQWTSAADTKALKYYYRTMRNHRIRVVDISNVDFTGTEIKSRLLDPDPNQDYEEISFSE